ncbi:MAG TPA: YHS domain-containing protein [Polyangiaceae bacterium]|nr:YHS domain-containing protein [Polyangiaceae bacterium]
MSTNHSMGVHAIGDQSKTARDPVCRMEVDIDETILQESYGGRTYHFCSDDCADIFRASPESYVPGVARA